MPSNPSEIPAEEEEFGMRRGEQTREKILDIAEDAVLAKGFGATSIEEVIAAVGITKSGFFYHFRDKNELARAMLVRFLKRDDAVLDDLFAVGEGEDPLAAFLKGLDRFAAIMGEMEQGHPGCLVATYCYNEVLFDREVRELNRLGVLAWRERFRRIFDAIDAHYPANDVVDIDALADMVSSVTEGGIVMAKALKEPGVLAEQIRLLRSYVKLLYTPSLAA